MLGEIKKENSRMLGFYKTCFALLFSFWLAASAFGQTTNSTQSAVIENAKEKILVQAMLPSFTNYKGIKIGMTDNEVREQLGKAIIDDKDGFYYQISDEEAVQIRLDKDKKVRFISVDYSGKADNKPKFEDIFGKEVEMKAKPDGSVYKLVRYPEAGYWVAYSRTAGESPIVTVTIQKMR